MSAEIVEDPTLRHRLSFEITERDGARMGRVEMWVDPGGGVPPHVHPVIREDFEVLEGKLQLLAGRDWHTVPAGETLSVPPGTRHAYRNRSGATTHAIAWVSPPSEELEGFLTDAAVLGRAGRLTRGGIPKTPSAVLQAAVLSEHYREMVELSSPPLPPLGLDRLLMPPLARLGRRRGFRPGAILGQG